MKDNDWQSRVEALLLKLVTIAQSAQPRAWEAFVALQSTGTTVTVYHPRAMPLSIPLDCTGDLDALAAEGALEMTRTPSGSRVFTITPEGYQRAYRGRYATSWAEP